jgi:hypothetical protein
MNRFLIRFALIATAFAMLQSCDSLYREDLEDCYDGVSVAIRIDPSMTDAEAAEMVAGRAVLYVFDSLGNFLERRETRIGRTEMLSYRDAGELTVVGWINKEDGIYNVTPFSESALRQDGLISLTSRTRAEGEYNLPTDLFYGDVAITNASTSFTVEHQDIYAARRTGQANITVRGLQDYAGMQDSDFYITTHDTASQIDFFGNPLNYTATHTPAGSFNSEREFLTGNFILAPDDSNTPLSIQIWHRTEGLIFETATHRDGAAIHIENDRTTNILIDFTMGVDITIVESAWGVSHPWKTFN